MSSLSPRSLRLIRHEESGWGYIEDWNKSTEENATFHAFIGYDNNEGMVELCDCITLSNMHGVVPLERLESQVKRIKEHFPGKQLYVMSVRKFNP